MKYKITKDFKVVRIDLKFPQQLGFVGSYDEYIVKVQQYQKAIEPRKIVVCEMPYEPPCVIMLRGQLYFIVVSYFEFLTELKPGMTVEGDECDNGIVITKILN